jgi:hypothetical protein
VVFGGDGGDQLVIVGGRSVLDRLRKEASLEPQSSPPMTHRGAGVERFELNSANSANNGWT